mmetsp:Transcript_37392/g.110381  ORF Transcript_37392/g.110381 Transcript_37392/m.110381 type:complete len:1168 (-) Transcript_37392:781-4284(-)
MQGGAGLADVEGFSAVADQFQVEKTAQKIQKGGLSNVLSFGRKAQADAGPASQFSLDDLLRHSSDGIPTSLLKMSNENASRAVKMFSGILKYQGESGEGLTTTQMFDIAQKLLHQGLKRPELKNELFMQLLKQTRGNPSAASTLKAWELFHVVASTMPPSKEFVGLISEYVHMVVQNEAGDPAVRDMATRAYSALNRSAKSGPRRTLPSTEELDALYSGRKLNTICFFLDETFEELAYDVTTSVLEAVEQIAGIIKLQNFNTFTLFECRRHLNPKPDVPMDEHVVLDDSKYISDILCELKNARMGAQDQYTSKLLFKKRMFRETDESITEPMFINLAYVQAQFDYLQGNYPVVREDASQMAALQIQAEYASTLMHDDESIMLCIEAYVAKQVLLTRPKEEWVGDVGSRYRALEHFSKEDARLQFLRILRSLPYGNSIFFAVRRIEDPIGLLPGKLVLGVNKRGVHFFRPAPREYLHSAELRDIMQFGSSSTAVFFKMRVAGVLHIFQFETRQGEDICMALQTHINDIMMKRYSKAKAMGASGGSDGGDAAAQPSAHADPLGLQQANYGAKYEEHMTQLQAQLEEVSARIAAAQKQADALAYEKEQCVGELEEVAEQLRREEAARNAVEERASSLQKSLEATRSELKLARAGTGAAAVSGPVDEAHLASLERELEGMSAEYDAAMTKLKALEKRAEQAARDKELVEKKIARADKAREEEVSEMSAKMELGADIREQIEAKEAKVSEALAEVASINALYEGLRGELAAVRADQQELTDLREMREDVERKEKQQAAIIDNQAKKLAELSRLHRDEQIMRKRYFNQMEDMQGKVRVMVRVNGDAGAVCAADQLTISTPSAGPEGLGFDAVFGAAASPDDVFAEVRPLVQAAIDGYNAAVLAFGARRSGAGAALFGGGEVPEERCLASRGVAELWRIVGRDASKFSFVVACSVLELREEALHDLLLPPALAKSPPRLDIKKDKRGIVTVVNAAKVQVASATEFKQAFKSAMSRRQQGSTLMLSFIVESTNLQTQNVFTGRLSFVDLGDAAAAGGAVATAFQGVVSALSSGQSAVPYTRSRLTSLLSDVLGGNAKTLMFTAVESDGSDADATLGLATQLRKIKNGSRKNELSKDQVRLKRQVDHYRELAGADAAAALALELSAVADRRDAGED